MVVLVLVAWVALVGMVEEGLAAVLEMAEMVVEMVGLVAMEMAEMVVMGWDCLLHHRSCWCETHQTELRMPRNAICRSS